MKNIIKLLAVLPLFAACDDLFSPAIENIRDLDAMSKEPTYAQGVLANAYILLPYQASPYSDVATDDAVTNNTAPSSNYGNYIYYLKMATGSWTAFTDPMSQWQGRKNAIQYINAFLERTDDVLWSEDELIRKLYNTRMTGEAYGLRAVHMYYLLLEHGGWTADGRLMGVPILTASESTTSDYNHARNTFQECIQQVLDDAAKAIELLPLDYTDLKDGDVIPAKYTALGLSSISDYNRVNGNLMKGRITGRIVEAIRSQAVLLAASPAFNTGTSLTWTDAANQAAIVLDRINGVSGLSSTGGTWYANTSEINNLASGANPAEILWRSDVSQSLSLEAENFPPSQYGYGRVNPTQNLVDAFPMVNGYPITDKVNSAYDETKPYENRDPRLANYIVFDGSKQGPSDEVITIGTYGTKNDVINKENMRSTRTGYYLRKLLRKDCNPDSRYNTQQKHYVARIRYTEIFLNYAEAANEAFGPTGKGTHNYSAYDVIKAIRARAGVGKSNGDAYLESIKNDPDKMRQLIRNERRLELCFESFRFHDLRRWKENLTETARGVRIENVGGTLKYTPIDVEVRNYKDYMYYGPIPYSEVLKWSNLEQNKGW